MNASETKIHGRRTAALGTRLIEKPVVYRLWQAPFAGRKFRPVKRHNDIGAAREVLDVGCGPGTNAQWFHESRYLGLDINPSYVETARRRHRREFAVADVTTWTPPEDRRPDFVLINSFLHHVDTPAVRRILARLREVTASDGHVHALELVLPERPSPARLLARWDRGDYARPLEEWRSLLSEHFEPVVFEPYPLGPPGLTLWSMVYFKGRPR